jgi:hypothetical protein
MPSFEYYKWIMNRFCFYLWIFEQAHADKTRSAFDKSQKKRKLCKRRAAIEPIIGHFKSDFRLSRNLLKGQVGNEINVLMAACAWNLRKWHYWRLVCVLQWHYSLHLVLIERLDALTRTIQLLVLKPKCSDGALL